MLLFIHNLPYSSHRNHVSIHLMLLFIDWFSSAVINSTSFQYISCYSLSEAKWISFTSVIVSIHLMLLFIKYHLCPVCLPHTFQYISCYSLSQVFRNLAKCFFRFNTSHVTLYRNNFVLSQGVFSFQYISCYSLSSKGEMRLTTVHVFQYISCYSLSKLREARDAEVNGFQYISCYSLSQHIQFVFKVRHTFQYISCYSLSVSSFRLVCTMRVSIHLMLLFIPLLYSISHT